MKKTAFFLPFLVFLVAACHNKSDKSKQSNQSKSDTTLIPSTEPVEEPQQTNDELGKLIPLDDDQLKALVPAELLGAPHSDIDVTSFAGARSLSTVFNINDSTSVALNITDCAGSAGAGMYSQWLSMLGNEEDDEEYKKTIGFNGAKALENCKKTKPECSFTYFSGKRFLVTLEGKGLKMDTLKEAAKRIPVK